MVILCWLIRTLEPVFPQVVYTQVNTEVENRFLIRLASLETGFKQNCWNKNSTGTNVCACVHACMHECMYMYACMHVCM